MLKEVNNQSGSRQNLWHRRNPLPGNGCALALGVALLWLLHAATAAAVPMEFDAGRNRLIAYMLNHQLPAQHFGHKPLDDKLSHDAYTLYLQVLDPQKRFFLQTDVEQLNAFAPGIDDALARGSIILPDAAADLLKERIKEVEEDVAAILEQGFSADTEEKLETDSDKMNHAASREERKERWRRILRMQTIDTYLDNAAADTVKAGEKNKQTEEENEETLNQEQWDKALTSVRNRTGQFLKRLQQETRQDYYDRYFDAVARAYDPHTSYMAPTFKEDFDIHMSGSLEGIGALLREDDGHIKVVEIIPGSAAQRQGELQAEDIILAVAEQDYEPVVISSMRIRDAVSYIRGPKGTEVRLTVEKPGGTKKVIAIVRDVVQIEETYVKSTLLNTPSGEKIGYIRIPSFYRDFDDSRKKGHARNVTDDTREALTRLRGEGMRALVLDLRNNGGGSLGDAVDVSGLFLPGGPVVQVRDSQGMIRVLEDEDSKVAYDGPLLVLVNKFSASASEILAAALQDYGRAVILGGDHTHGKGTVQALLDMNRNLPILQKKKYDDLGALKITIQKFYRINGQSTQFKGVEPDIVVPTEIDFLESGEQYLDHALPWDQVDDVGYARWQGAYLDLGDARTRLQQWLSTSEEFKKIREKSDRFKQRQEKTLATVSLPAIRQERKQLARLDDPAAFVEDGEPEHGAASSNKDKPLPEQLRDDPLVQASLVILDTSSALPTTALKMQTKE